MSASPTQKLFPSMDVPECGMPDFRMSGAMCLSLYPAKANINSKLQTSLFKFVSLFLLDFHSPWYFLNTVKWFRKATKDKTRKRTLDSYG